MNAPPLIFVVDDDASIRRALSRLIRAMDMNVEAFGEAEQVIERLAANPPGCILLDLQMPGLTGLELQSELASRGIRTPVVFISGHGDVPSSVTAMKMGACDFLTKPIDEQNVLAAIQNALALDARRRIEQSERDIVNERVSQLTPREFEVLRHIIAGKLNKQIAFDLGTGEKTIKVHRARVLAKMQAGSVAELTRLAARAGITPAETGAS